MRRCLPAPLVLAALATALPASAQELLYEFLPPNGGYLTWCGRAVTVHGSRFAVTSGWTVYVCDLESGQALYQVESPEGPSGQFGSSIALSSKYLLVGEPYAHAEDGAVHVFDAVTGAPLAVLHGDPIRERFGVGVAVDGDVALVGAPMSSTGTRKSGEVVAIDLATGLELGRVSPPDEQDFQLFGGAVALQGSYAVVGANAQNDEQGAAYVLDTATWEILRVLEVSGSSRLGVDLAISSSRVVVGSLAGSGEFPKAFLFDIPTGDHLLTFEPEDGVGALYFGRSVDFNEAGILVGASGASFASTGTGAAYMFSAQTGEQILKLGLEDGQSGDEFGGRVTLSSRGIALCSATGVDAQGLNSGAVYALRTPRPWYVSPTTGRQYTWTDSAASWHEARQEAIALGGELATVHDAVENAWLADVLPDDGLALWIGLSDEAQEGTFVWASGEPFTYSSWRPGEPDDLFGADWAVFDPATGLWRDEPAAPARRALVEVGSVDCDGNGIPDASEIGDDPSRDWNGDGELDICVTPFTCEALPNSTGVPAEISAVGSPLVADDDLTLLGMHLPVDVLGYFMLSAETGEVPFFGGSSGILCLGGTIARLNRPPQGALLHSGDFGTMEFRLHLDDLPMGIVVQPGEHWYFQLWFRDYDSGPTSNTTPGLDVLFR